MEEAVDLSLQSQEDIIRLPQRIISLVAIWVQHKPLGAVGALICIVMIVLALGADVVAPYGINETSRADQLAPPSASHWFGADHFGRDVFSRVVHGARISMIVGFGGTALAMGLATLVGIISAYFRGWVDMVIQRLVDAWMSFPGIVVALTMVALIGTGVVNLILVIGLLFGFRESRVIRSQVLSIADRGYMEAANALGASPLRMMLRHILPNTFVPVIILATLQLPAVILIEAGLSFLGFGIAPPTPSWGAMLTGEARQYMLDAPWLVLAPGIFLSLTVFGWNMFGDALRDLLDPAMSGSIARREH